MVIEHLTCDVGHVTKSKNKSNLKHQICFIPCVFFKNLPKRKLFAPSTFCEKQKILRSVVHSWSHEWFRLALPSLLHNSWVQWTLSAAWQEGLMQPEYRFSMSFWLEGTWKYVAHTDSLFFHQAQKNQRNLMLVSFFNDLEHYNFVTLLRRRCWVTSSSFHGCPEFIEVQDFFFAVKMSPQRVKMWQKQKTAKNCLGFYDWLTCHYDTFVYQDHCSLWHKNTCLPLKLYILVT